MALNMENKAADIEYKPAVWKMTISIFHNNKNKEKFRRLPVYRYQPDNLMRKR